MLKALGEPSRAGLHVVFRSPELTILNVVWGPRMCQLPHNHKMWAVIGMYTGARTTSSGGGCRAHPTAGSRPPGPRRSSDRDAAPLGPDIIHSVVNPLKRLTGAIHVYGGDFFAVPRSEWDPERLVEQAFDVDKALALFEESNRLYPSPARGGRG